MYSLNLQVMEYPFYCSCDGRDQRLEVFDSQKKKKKTERDLSELLCYDIHMESSHWT